MLELVKYQTHIPNFEPVVNLQMHLYGHRKKIEQLSKIKGILDHNELRFKNTAEHQDLVAQLLLNTQETQIKYFYLQGAVSGQREFLNKRLVLASTVVLSRTSENMYIIITNFLIKHKSFWRIIFAMRHLKEISIVECTLKIERPISIAAEMEHFNLIQIRFNN